MAEVIPIDAKLGVNRVRVRLDGVFFRLRFQWSGRFLTWSMSLESDDGVAILQSARVTADAGITLSQTQAGMPRGEIVPVDTSGRGADPGREDLGTRVLIVYLTEAELAA